MQHDSRTETTTQDWTGQAEERVRGVRRRIMQRRKRCSDLEAVRVTGGSSDEINDPAFDVLISSESRYYYCMDVRGVLFRNVETVLETSLRSSAKLGTLHKKLGPPVTSILDCITSSDQ